MLLKNVNDIDNLLEAIYKCNGDVILRSADGAEQFNMKSRLSRYMAIGKLCEEHGEDYEFFCMDKSDEGYLFQFFSELRQ